MHVEDAGIWWQTHVELFGGVGAQLEDDDVRALRRPRWGELQRLQQRRCLEIDHWIWMLVLFISVPDTSRKKQVNHIGWWIRVSMITKTKCSNTWRSSILFAAAGWEGLLELCMCQAQGMQASWSHDLRFTMALLSNCTETVCEAKLHQGGEERRWHPQNSDHW